MTLIFDGPVTPDAATVFVRSIPTPEDHLLNSLLPDRLVTEQTLKFSEFTRQQRVVPFRAYDGNIPTFERDSMTSKAVDMLPLSSMAGKGELERLGLEKTRQAGGSVAAVTEAIYDDLEGCTRVVRNRVEIARGDVLTDGKLTLAGENGVYAEADFGIPSTNFVDASISWGSEAATVITDILGWTEQYIKENGFPPGGMVVSRRVLGLLQRNAEFRTYAGIQAGGPSTVTQSAVHSILSDYGLPPVTLVYDTVIDGRVLPEDKVLFVPPAGTELGYTAWGVSATALELVGAAQSDLAFSDAPGLVGAVVKDGPPFRERTFVDSIVLPVITNPRALMIADVAL